MTDASYQLDKENNTNNNNINNNTSSKVSCISPRSKIILIALIMSIIAIVIIIIILLVVLKKHSYITASNMDYSGFVIVNDVIPDIVTEMRYYSTFNFVGAHIDGYEEPVALLTKEAAEKLKKRVINWIVWNIE